MHAQSFEIMKYFSDQYLKKNDQLKILDVGSYDVNGNFRNLFLNKNWKYTGLDIVSGPNVDVVSKSAYDFGLEEQFDVVVSGNCLEHVEAPWKWIKEVEKVIKKGGLLCIVTPLSIGEHRFPLDCWRILPDGYKYLLEKESDFSVLEAKISYAAPEIRYKFFHHRPKIKWLLKLFPGKIKDLLFGYYINGIEDTFVIAVKN
jgi:SAM-dependent methyltransferase